ncbi:peroxidase [Tetranychus urticae]|uniref:Peroxidase n=1 Tax=Tetranychus urticae TaxID=32264 RepID=T1KDX4_TETUR|nr:peroxidase [Tetranychus urticae]
MIRFSILILSFASIGLCSDYNDIERPPHSGPPYGTDYSPECALIVSRSKPYSPDHEPIKMSPGLHYISNYAPRLKRSSYYPGEGQICITYEDINRAVHEAKVRLGSYVPEEIKELSSDLPKESHISVSAEIVLEATRILAQWYDLSKETILFGLPRIDTYRTAIRDICPSFLKPVKCEISKYRTLTGMCNNLDYPSWGSARSAMVRFLPPAYADGISEPRRSADDDSELPSPRLVSFIIHQDVSERDQYITNLLMAFGQLIDHDMTFGATATNEFGDILKCCEEEDSSHPACLPIKVPRDDPFYKFFKRTCMSFVRVLAGLKPGCPLGPRGQINAISAVLDGNFIYGSSQEVCQKLRALKGGRLKTTAMYKELGLKDLLPMKTSDPDKGCERSGRPRNMFCFEAGDRRANEQLGITTLHTIFMREHNRIADYLAFANPHWDDETVFQETRRIVVAEIQHITFNEYLPVLLGREKMSKYGLDLVENDFYNGYDPKINPGMRLGFQAAAYRFGHSILPDVIERYNKYHDKIESIRLSQLLLQPYELYKPGYLDSFILGLVNQQANRMDPEVSTEVTNHLFEKPGDHFGADLASINVQRGREVGLPGYNAYREFCGLRKAKGFYDLIGTFDNKTVHRMASIYKHVDDIDLWSAGVAEYPAPGSLIGPTFACIIGEQFANLRRGDRFWYENSGWPSSLSLEQLNEVRKVKLAKLLCDNADDIQTIQLYPLLMPDHHSNPYVECRDLPAMDLSVFNDYSYKSKAKAAAAKARGA